MIALICHGGLVALTVARVACRTAGAFGLAPLFIAGALAGSTWNVAAEPEVHEVDIRNGRQVDVHIPHVRNRPTADRSCLLFAERTYGSTPDRPVARPPSPALDGTRSDLAVIPPFRFDLCRFSATG